MPVTLWQHRAVGMLLCNSSWLCAGQNSAKVQINLKVKSVMVSQRTVTLDTMYFPAEHQPEIQSQSCTEWKNNVNVWKCGWTLKLLFSPNLHAALHSLTNYAKRNQKMLCWGCYRHTLSINSKLKLLPQVTLRRIALKGMNTCAVSLFVAFIRNLDALVEISSHFDIEEYFLLLFRKKLNCIHLKHSKF